jgi:hypothetical protein
MSRCVPPLYMQPSRSQPKCASRGRFEWTINIPINIHRRSTCIPLYIWSTAFDYQRRKKIVFKKKNSLQLFLCHRHRRIIVCSSVADYSVPGLYLAENYKRQFSFVYLRAQINVQLRPIYSHSALYFTVLHFGFNATAVHNAYRITSCRS